MTLLWVSIIWVFASFAVAMLPMRLQYAPGVVLLLAAPVLIYLIAVELGLLAAIFATLAFISMFRNPLGYLWSRMRGKRPELPE